MSAPVKPRLADGVELLGEFQDSGFKEPPSLVRRRDGQVLQLPRLLYLVVERLDGNHEVGEIARAVSAAVGRELSGEGVRFLIDEKLAPLGLVAGSVPAQLTRADPMLALRLRAAVVPSGVVQALARVFAPLFAPAVVVAVLAGVVGLDIWVFAVKGLAQPLRSLLADPLLLIALLALVVVSAVFHETGHAAACRYSGARPGAMGVGLYLVWPAFYTDVTDAYRLGRRGRLRTDLGGVYFNCVFMLACALTAIATGFTPLLLFVPLQHLEILHQLLPVLRLDGYLIVSDLAGVPDILGRLRPTLSSLLPWRETDPAMSRLKRGPRIAVSAYILIVVPLLLAALGLMLVSTPRILGTAWHALLVQFHGASHAFGDGDTALGLVGSVEMAVLVLPAAALVLGLVRAVRRLGSAARRRGPRARAATVVGLAATAALLGYAWWPRSADYRSLQASDAGTFQDGLQALDRLTQTAPPSRGPAPIAAVVSSHAEPALATVQGGTPVHARRRPTGGHGPTARPSAANGELRRRGRRPRTVDTATTQTTPAATSIPTTTAATCTTPATTDTTTTGADPAETTGTTDTGTTPTGATTDTTTTTTTPDATTTAATTSKSSPATTAATPPCP